MNSFIDPASSPRIKLIGYGALWLLMAYWTLQLLRPVDGPPWIFLDNLNLLIHEAGHWLFMPFGQFMHILGGSLSQCLMPIAFLAYFIYQRDWGGGSFATFWLGDNIINVSYYIGDAQSMSLPLLGGDTSGHDWHNLLTMTDLLKYDQLIAGLVRISGTVCVLVALIGLMIAGLLIWLSATDATPSQPTSGAAQ